MAQHQQHPLDRAIRNSLNDSMAYILTPRINYPAVDANSVIAHLEHLGKSKKIDWTRDSNCMLHWDQCLVFWHEATSDHAMPEGDVVRGSSDVFISIAMQRREDTGDVYLYCHEISMSFGSDLGGAGAFPMLLDEFCFLLDSDGCLKMLLPYGEMIQSDPDAVDRWNRMNKGHVNKPINKEQLLALSGYVSGNTNNTNTLRVLLELGMFLNARGVRTVDVSNAPTLHKKWRKEGHPVYSYKKLVIDPSAYKAKHASEAEADENGVALHLCRGHFRVYTKDKPLFGRYVGRFWVPQHLRGDPELGTIEKQYSVATSHP